MNRVNFETRGNEKAIVGTVSTYSVLFRIKSFPKKKSIYIEFHLEMCGMVLTYKQQNGKAHV